MLINGNNPLDYVESTRVTKMAQELAARHARRPPDKPTCYNPAL